MSNKKMDKATMRWKKIEQFLETHDYITSTNVRELCGVLTATANRVLPGLVSKSKFIRCRECKHRAYKLSI